MADVAQLVEPQVVILVVAGSIPVIRPNIFKPLQYCEGFFVFIGFKIYLGK